MPTYVVLWNFTEQGMKNIKNGPAMRQGAEQALAAKGGKLIWSGLTFGQYDGVAVVDLPNDAATLEIALMMGMQGMYQTETLRAFPPDEADQITARLP